jgi:cytochrome c
MRCTGLIRALTGVAVAATPACTGKSASSGSTAEAPSVIRYEANVSAGGAAPPAGALKNPHSDTKQSADAGAALFASMNCDGCHGGGAVGWVGPSLVDGRWRYGGADAEVFTSIFYGRPKGMPAYGGVIGTDGIWMLVAYLKSQAVPGVVPTTSWLPGGSAMPPPAAPAAPAAAHEGSATAPTEASVSPDQMPAKYGCTACHAADHKVIGPSFKEVAAKYRGKDVEATLVEKVKNGGSGVWGQVPMTPNPQVPDQDLHAIVKWILALK